MKNESILILGAGLMQIPGIKAAKKNNLKTFVVDADENAPGVKEADVFKKIDLKNYIDIYEYAKELKKSEGLKGIFTCGTDFSSSVSYASEKLGFPAHCYESSLNASIKPRMRECFAKQNVSSPKFYSAKNETEALEKIKQLGFPCVVKPADNMGSRGCRLIRNENESASALKNAFENSRTNTIILEEYMNGPEYSIDAIVYEDSLTICGFADRHIYFSPYFIETGHTMPANIDDKRKLELISCFASGIKSLGLTCGAAKADIKYTENGPEIGEIAARLSGGYMSGWTFPYSSDFDLIEQAVLISVGRKPVDLISERKELDFSHVENCAKLDKPFKLYEIPSVKVSAERAWISIPGKIKSIKGIEDAEKSSGVKNVLPRGFIEGDEVDFPRNNVQKCGNIISLGSTRNEAVNYSEKAASKIFIRLEKNNNKTNDFLDGKYLADEEGFPPVKFEGFYIVKKMNLDGVIPENKSVLEDAPQEILDLLKDSEKSWSYMTAYEEAEKIDIYYKKHPSISRKKFWKAFFRGGLQAAVYVCDCEVGK